MLDDIKSQIANSVSAQTQPQISQLFDNLNSQIQLFFTIGIVLSILWGLLLIFTAVQRYRTHAAIMRMDKNLQKLVASSGIDDEPDSSNHGAS